jgi:FAD:protein FMN transferase
LTPHRHRFTAMGGPCELQVYAPDAAAQAACGAGEAEVRRLERKYSRYRDDSVTTQVNRSAGRAEGIAVDDETAALLDYAATAWQQGDGLFDVTTGALRRAWDFKARRVPAREAVAVALMDVGWQRLEWRKPQLLLPAGMEVDFGGIVKEYAADCARRVLLEAGCVHGLVELGGDIAIAGPHPDGAPWHVGIRDPRDPEKPLATVDLPAGAIATSGDYERFFEHDGVRYCHILDARTGWPAQGLSSVSVLAEQCLVAGTASTIAMLKGPRDGPAWLASLGLPYLAVDSAGAIRGTLC